MKREFTNEQLEQFLKQNADNLRMKAPDRIWQNLSGELSKRKRRFVVRLSAFLLVTSALGYFTITELIPSPNVPAQQIRLHQNPSSTSIVQEITDKPQSAYLPGQPPSANAPISSKKLNNGTAAPATAEATPVLTNETNSLQFNEPVPPMAFSPTVVDSYTELENQPITEPDESRPATVTPNETLPLTIESVHNYYRPKAKRKRLEKQFHLTPTISYRTLSENKPFLKNISPFNPPANYSALYSNVNNMVTHKPNVGFEMGYTFKYAATSTIKLRTGLQFNVNRYDIKAFSSPLSIATIALNGRSRVDSLSMISGYSNMNGYKSNWLRNFSFQFSVPVGVELALKGTEHMQFGIASSIQPTYVLGDRAYLLTTDYKSYTEVPWLLRRWNVNTALETFVSYQRGKTQWQVGPQVRYQLLSSFISKYPVKENLFDFGLKVGVTINK